MTTTEPLQMVRLALDPAQLARIGRGLRLPRRQSDNGLLVHSLLAALFGPGAIRPFHLETAQEGRRGRQGSVPVLGYCTRTEEELRDHATSFSDPRDFAACDWDALAVKPMPTEWRVGAKLGFSARICPVVRLASTIETRAKDESPRRYTKGSEVDAWVHRNFLAGGDDRKVSREAVYREWFQERLGGAGLVSEARLRSFRRTRLVRRTRGPKRKARILERPDCVVEGTLEIADGDRFDLLLRRGVGRHAAFGFGMLLLQSTTA